MKKTPAYTLTTLAILILTLILGGCRSAVADDTYQYDELEDELFAYKTRLLELENKLLLVQNEQFESELEYLSEIKKLTGEITALRQLIYAEDVVPPVEDDTGAYVGFIYEIDNGQVTITGYSGDSLSLIIPASIDGFTVTKIDDGAFKTLNITSVTIPDTVVSIGWFAFSDCASLTRVFIPQSVVSIGYEAFSGCKQLTVYATKDSYAEKYAKSYGIPLSIE